MLFNEAEQLQGDEIRGVSRSQLVVVDRAELLNLNLASSLT